MPDVMPLLLKTGRVEAPSQPPRLACESQLRVAAATLARASADEVIATTAVGVLGADDLATFNSVVAAMQDDFGLEARVRLRVGSFSVRFTRRARD
jgi:hypothetical protein